MVYFKSMKNNFFFLIIGGMLTTTLYTFAAPPASPYITADAALDPVCVPGSVNCFVDLGFNG